MIEEQIVQGQIYLGKQGENQIRQVRFTDVPIWKRVYGEGVCELWHTRCGEEEPYQVPFEYDNGCAIWSVCTYDTALNGNGSCELRYIVNGEVVKAETYITKVLALEDVTSEEDSAELLSGWVEEVLEAKAKVEELCNDLPDSFNVDTSLDASSGNAIANKTVTNKFTSQGALIEAKANNTLSNVPNATFKAKAEASGISGGSGGGMDFKGEVETLPDSANEGDVYRVTQPIKSGKLSITVSGVQSVEENPDGIDGSLVIYMDIASPLYTFFCYARDLQYGDNEDGRTGDSYIEYNGRTYMIPWMYGTGHGDNSNGVIFSSYSSDFMNIFANGNSILCYSDTMAYLPESLKAYDGYPEDTMFIYRNGEWEVFVESDAILESKVASVENKLANKADAIHYHSASNISSGTLSVLRGGTGKGSWSSNRIIYPNGSTSFAQLAFPSEESVLAQKSSGSPFWKKLSELGGSGGGHKKIGFTSDCDYIATSADGYMAFVNAINNAKDNDIIIVMPGTYNSSNTLIISKNINFVGVGMPIINFNVRTDGGGDFSYENWEWVTAPYGYDTAWNGFKFKKDFVTGCEANPDNEYGNGTNSAFNCIFEGTSASIIGTFENCVFDVLYFGGGHYFGSSESRFYNCYMKFINFDRSSGNDFFTNCNFYPEPDMYMYLTTFNAYCMKGCKFYCLDNSFSISCSHSSQLHFNDTIFYANSVAYDDYYGDSGGYIIPLSTS